MAAKGVPINAVYSTTLSPDEATRRIYTAVCQMGGGYSDGTQALMNGNSLITLTRKYLPTWAIVVAVLGALFLLIGLLALLARSTETCTISCQVGANGTTTISINGTLGQNVYNALQAVLAQMQAWQ